MPKVFYTAGPGNAFATLRDFIEGREDGSTSHVAYSRQFYEACARHDATARVTCTHGQDAARLSGRGIELVRRANPSAGKSGLAWYWAEWLKARRNMAEARNFGADLVVLAEDSQPAFYAPLLRRGVTVVQVLHTRLWREGRRPSPMQRLWLGGFGRACAGRLAAVLSCSDVVTGQVRRLAGDRLSPVIEFLPLYRPHHYGGIAPPDAAAARPGIAFVGRVEANKGVFDLIGAARALAAQGTPAQFHICGTGPALEAMRAAAAAAGQGDSFTFHGWCDRARLREVLAGCQIGVVPTRSGFIEGFNQVAVEMVLAGRPVVLSDVCPAAGYLGAAAVSFPADDERAMSAALGRLIADRAELARRAAACAGAGARFFDERSSFGAALDEVFSALRERRAPRARLIPPRG